MTKVIPPFLGQHIGFVNGAWLARADEWCELKGSTFRVKISDVYR